MYYEHNLLRPVFEQQNLVDSIAADILHVRRGINPLYSLVSLRCYMLNSRVGADCSPNLRQVWSSISSVGWIASAWSLF